MDDNIKLRRQVFGAALIGVGALLLVAAVVSRFRYVGYLAWICVGAGVWMLRRRPAP